MSSRKFIRAMFLIAISVCLYSPAQSAKAADALFWILCNCNPHNQADANFQISAQVSEYSHLGDGPIGGGFAPGDEVIIQRSNGSSIARWIFTLGHGWDEVQDPDFVCGFFDDPCVDLTPLHTLPHPPWIVPGGSDGTCSLTPTLYASFPMTGSASNDVRIMSAKPLQSAAISKMEDASHANSGTIIPQMFVEDRGKGYMTSRLAPVRFENGTLKIYYIAHERNGREMQALPELSLSGLPVPKLGGDPIRGVVQIDLWEDESVHSVKLWLPNGSVINDGPLVDQIQHRLVVDYGDEQRRHRLIYFQRFERTAFGELRLYGESFADQPLCGCGGCSPAHCWPQ